MLGVHALASHWWLLLIRGLLAIAFGVIALVYPVATIGVLVILFGAFALVDGVFVIVAALRFSHPDSGRWWWMLVQGLIGVAIGVVTFFWPGITALALGLLIAAWAIATGVLELGAAFRLRRDVPGEIFLGLAGALSLIAGIILAFSPFFALLVWVWILAAYAIIAGIALVALSFRLRALRSQPGTA